VRLAAALTVFQGGFTAQAAQQLWQADADGLDPHLLLDELLSHSLLKSQASPEGTLRFEFYEPIREFAATQSGHDDPDVRRHWRARHRAWARAWAQALPATAPLPEMRRELANLGAALASAAADEAPAEGVSLLLALGRVLEDVELGALALADATRCVAQCTDALLRSRGQSVLGTLLYTAGQVDAGIAHAEAGLSQLAGDAPAAMRVRALLALARVRWRSRRQVDTVEPLLDEADRLLQGLAGPPELKAMAHAQRAFVTSRLHRDHAAAQTLHEQALAGWQASGNQHAINSGLYNLAVCAQDAGHHRVAIEQLDRVVASVHALDDRRRLSQALNVRGNALSELRQWPAAVSAFRDSLREAWGAMAPYEIAFALWNMPRALAHVREPRLALQLAAFAERFWTTRFGALTPADHIDLRRVQRLCARQLDAAARRAEWLAGQQLELAAAVELALRDN
jgi:tetratricopeptide (TPR) repeat protein